ncbi:MAG: IS66 family transposase zinc-finger binding domain-containing protein [Ruminococcus sp.]|nr:IS66 family transposase zinc-finger binding domain-containing protein [Ruminococcus sp.]
MEHELSEEERKCPECGEEMEVIGKKVTKHLEMIPVQVRIREDVYFTYACRKCHENEADTPVVETPQPNPVIKGRRVIRRMTLELESDPEVIRYRCDAFEDIMRFPSLRERLTTALDQLNYMKTLGSAFMDETVAPLWQLINRLRELEIYINCITEIHKALSGTPVQSEGMLRLKEYVSSIYNGSGFEYLSADIKALLTETSEIQNITLGVNLDSMLRPVEVGIMSVNHKRFNHTGVLDKFIKFLPQIGAMMDGRAVDSLTKIHSGGGTAEDDPLMKNLCGTMTDMLGSTVKHLNSTLSRYVNINGYSLTRFIPELLFYIRWADFCAKIMNAGLPMTRPEILDSGSRSLRLSPCDNILTHFPADENKTVNLGRLGEESKRISEIFAAATDRSVLLFNESLSTTSFTEGLYIAKDVVRALRCLGARTVFNTHMHELAMGLDEMNSTAGDTKVASLITGIHEGQRSYKVEIAPPDGVSYARDIAEKYGVSFEQLRHSICA